MGWKHIVVEGHCFYDSDSSEKEESKDLDRCRNKIGEVGLHCLELNKGKLCAYLGYGKARASIVVTDSKGEAVNGSCFFPEDAFKLSDKDFVEKENEWIRRWSEKIDEDKNDVGD